MGNKQSTRHSISTNHTTVCETTTLRSTALSHVNLIDEVQNNPNHPSQFVNSMKTPMQKNPFETKKLPWQQDKGKAISNRNKSKWWKELNIFRHHKSSKNLNVPTFPLSIARTENIESNVNWNDYYICQSSSFSPRHWQFIASQEPTQIEYMINVAALTAMEALYDFDESLVEDEEDEIQEKVIYNPSNEYDNEYKEKCFQNSNDDYHHDKRRSSTMMTVLSDFDDELHA